MKKYEIRIDVPCYEEGTTECHRIIVEGESHKYTLHEFMNDHYEGLGVGPECMNCIAFYNGNYYTVIPLDKINQIEIKECK